MRIISFAHTTQALLAGRKTVTRREWDDAYGTRFKAGELVQAWDRSPRFHGKQVGVIKLTQKPYLEHIEHMPDSDYEAEGFAYLNEHLELVNVRRYGTFTRADFDLWRSGDHLLWVVRFEMVTVY